MEKDTLHRLQLQIMKDAIATLIENGSKADVYEHERCITLLKEAWNGALDLEDETADALSKIKMEKETMRQIEEGAKLNHVIGENELTYSASAEETASLLECLFKSAVRLLDPGEWDSLFEMAKSIMSRIEPEECLDVSFKMA